MQTVAVVLESPEQLKLRTVELTPVHPSDAVVEVLWTGISTGTERLLWSGRMPHFPGMGYPLVPGYETVGRIVSAPEGSRFHEGDHVFVPGANCFGEIKGLFGGAAARLVVPAERLVPIDGALGENGILIALAATAYHAIAGDGAELPELIVGHGILGRLLARITVAVGGDAPVVWERQESRRGGQASYSVIDPESDKRRDYRTICDASGDAAILDQLIGRLARRGEITLAGFYEQPLSFAFPPAFMREARMRVAAEWTRPDITAVTDLIASGLLSLDGLITNRAASHDAPDAYRTAFRDASCLKMVLDWRHAA
jgi:3-hydroxyethyl bacteriochlorophyllide a dehydrogenase